MPKGARETYPSLLFGNERYLHAFWTLSRRRPRGFDGPQPIPMQDISIYADRMGFDFETLAGRLAACDETFLDTVLKKKSKPEEVTPDG